MYGFSVGCDFREGPTPADLLAEVRAMSDFFRPAGIRLRSGSIGLPEPEFLAPLLEGERRSTDPRLTTLEAPPLVWPPPPAGTGSPREAFFACLNGTVRLQLGAGPAAPTGRFFREWNGGEPLRILLVFLHGFPAGGSSVRFWTESHVWLSRCARNPIPGAADENLLELASRVEALARRFGDRLESAPANFSQLKGPFREEQDRLRSAFAQVPRFAPEAG